VFKLQVNQLSTNKSISDISQAVQQQFDQINQQILANYDNTLTKKHKAFKDIVEFMQQFKLD